MRTFPQSFEAAEPLLKEYGFEAETEQLTIRAALETSFEQVDGPECTRMDIILQTVLTSPDHTPVLTYGPAGLIAGYTTSELYGSPVVMRPHPHGGFSFSVVLSDGLVCSYDKQAPRCSLDEADDFFEIELGRDDKGQPTRTDVWVGEKAIIHSPALEHESDMYAVFRHLHIYTK